MAWEFAGLDAPKDIKSIVEQATDEEEKKQVEVRKMGYKTL